MGRGARGGRPTTGPNSPAASTGEGFDELAVANASFFIDKLGAECGDLQGLRELTVNGFEAIAALGQGAAGRVVWDADGQRLENTATRKLLVMDPGVGMTPEVSERREGSAGTLVTQRRSSRGTRAARHVLALGDQPVDGPTAQRFVRARVGLLETVVELQLVVALVGDWSPVASRLTGPQKRQKPRGYRGS